MERKWLHSFEDEQFTMDILDGLAGLRDEAVLEQNMLLLDPNRNAAEGGAIDKDGDDRAALNHDNGDESLANEGAAGSQSEDQVIMAPMESNDDPLDTPLLPPWQSKSTGAAHTSGDAAQRSTLQLKGATIPVWDPGSCPNLALLGGTAIQLRTNLSIPLNRIRCKISSQVLRG